MNTKLPIKEGSLLAQMIQSSDKKKIPQPKRIKNPKTTERLYYQLLNNFIRRSQNLFREIVVPAGKKFFLGDEKKKTFAQENYDKILSALEKWKKKVSEEVFSAQAIENAVSEVSEQINARNITETKKTYDRITPVDLTSFIASASSQKKSFVMENADLIKKVSEDIKANVQRIVGDRVPAGARWESIVGEVEKGLKGNAGVFKSARQRARLIARDQVNKFNGELTRARQEELGMRLYRWSTAGDSRVRSAHEKLDGKIFSWRGVVRINGQTFKPATNTAGMEIIPGQEINCRCVAEPVWEV